MRLSDPDSKDFLILSQKKHFLIFRETKLSGPNITKFWERTFRVHKINKTHCEKISHILGNGKHFVI